MKKVCDKCGLGAYIPCSKHNEEVEKYKKLIQKMQIIIGILSISLLITYLCLFVLGCTPI